MQHQRSRLDTENTLYTTNQVAQQVVSEVDLATRARAADEVAQLHQQLGRELLNQLQMQLDVQLGLVISSSGASC